MSKVDFKTTLKELYAPPKKFVRVKVPEMQFLMVDGHGDPNVAQEYKASAEVSFRLPNGGGASWELMMDTRSPDAPLLEGGARYEGGDSYRIAPRSVILLRHALG